MTKTSPTTEPRSGFTLVELLVALAVSGLVLAAATGCWFAALRAHRAVAQGAALAQCLRTAQERLGDDLARAAAPPLVDAGTIAFPARDAAGRPGRCTWTVERRLVRTWRPDAGPAEELAWPLDGLSASFAELPGRGVRLRWRLGDDPADPPLAGALVMLADPPEPRR